MNVLQHTRNELNLCLKQSRPDRSYRDTLLTGRSWLSEQRHFSAKSKILTNSQLSFEPLEANYLHICEEICLHPLQGKYKDGIDKQRMKGYR